MSNPYESRWSIVADLMRCQHCGLVHIERQDAPDIDTFCPECNAPSEFCDYEFGGQIIAAVEAALAKGREENPHV